MRILQVCPYDLSRPGGVQQHVKSLAHALRGRGHEVTILSPGRQGSEEALELRAGYMKKISFAGTAFEISYLSKAERGRIAGWMQAWKPDAVHFHTLWSPLLCWQVFRLTRVARIATFHDTAPPGLAGSILRAIFKLLSRSLLKRIQVAIAVSEVPLAHLRPARGGAVPVVIAPAIDLSAFFNVIHDGIGTDVVFIGRLEPRKGIAVLIEAWERIASGAVPIGARAVPRLIVAGSGELEGLVKAAEVCLGPHVLLHVPAPSQARKLELLAGACLAVSPALYGESFGLVLVEAMAAGVPIIGASNAGYSSVLKGEGANLLVPPGDADALARKIISLLGDAPQRARLQAWGRQEARQYDVAALAGQFEEIYRRAASCAGPV